VAPKHIQRRADVIYILQHFVSILSGIAAVAVNLAILAVLGTATAIVTRKRYPTSLANVTVPAACMVALYCWYGTKLNVPLPHLLGAVVCLAVGIFAYRVFRNGPAAAVTDSQLAAIFNRRSSVFVLFYAVAYLFLTPAVLADHLPIATLGNPDILNYINVGDHLQHLGSSNIAGLSLVRTTSYISTPAVFPALQAMATFLGGGIMHAAMPTMLGIVALIGVVVASITQTAFALPRVVSVALATVLIFGPMFRYLSGNFFLSQLMGSLVLLLLLSKTLELIGDKRSKSWIGVFTSFAPHYILIAYLYPVFMGITVGLQTILFAGTYAHPATSRGEQANRNGRTRATILPWAAGVSSCLIVVVAVDPVHFQQMMGLAFVLLNIQAGWALSLVSPAAILGLPGGLQITMRSAQIASTVGLLVVTTVIGYGYLVRGMGRGPVAGSVLFLIAVLSFAIYIAYFYLVGPSYQQWKLATYLPLMMSFAWWAACVSTTRAMMKSQWLADLATISLCALLVVGNFVHYALREPPMRTLSASYANLQALDVTGFGTELYISMTGWGATFLPVYFVRNKTLHLLSDSYYPKEKLDRASVSPTRPLFVEGADCTPETAWTTTVVGVGCLYRQPPTVEFGFNYRLSSPLPITIEAEGLSVQESWGRWSDGNKVGFRLFASRTDLSKAPVGFVNFTMHPFARLGGSQQVAITWGDWHTEEVIDQPRTISLPYVRDDWKGAELPTMTVWMDLPGAVSPRDLDASSKDTRRLAIGFTAIGVSSAALGTIIRGDR
jgi:hypothetical protein